MRMEPILPSWTRKTPRTESRTSVLSRESQHRPGLRNGTRVRPDVPRLLHHVVALANKDHVATAAVGRRRQQSIEVLLLQVANPEMREPPGAS